MPEPTVPITVLVPRSLKRWLAEWARKEDKKVGPYVRAILETHRQAHAITQPDTTKE